MNCHAFTPVPYSSPVFSLSKTIATRNHIQEPSITLHPVADSQYLTTRHIRTKSTSQCSLTKTSPTGLHMSLAPSILVETRNNGELTSPQPTQIPPSTIRASCIPSCSALMRCQSHWAVTLSSKSRPSMMVPSSKWFDGK